MIDKLKQEINIGDTIVYNPPQYKGLKIDIVKSFYGSKSVRLNNGDGRFSKEIIVINEQIGIAKEKYPENYI